jgi:hypothetical protein
MKCDGCIYLGTVFEHLKNFQGTEEWRACMYPLPWHVSDRAVPMGIEHNCKVYLNSSKKIKKE